VQHYMIGGIATDLHGRTNVSGLYAVGEAASTGVHGANRLAANSMLECLVFGRRAAWEVNRSMGDDAPSVSCPITMPDRPVFTVDEPRLRRRVQAIMDTHGGVVRGAIGLMQAQDEIQRIRAELEAGFDNRRAYIELVNITTIAEAILTGALARAKSVGAHYRED